MFTENDSKSNSEEEKLPGSNRNLNAPNNTINPCKHLSISSVSEESESKPLIIEFKNFGQFINHYLVQMSKTNLVKIERDLYKINKIFYQFDPGEIMIQDLILMYPKIELESVSHDLRDSNYIKDVDNIIVEDPCISIKFRILEKVVSLISCLSAKWKVFKMQKFMYRMNPRIQYTKILNIEKINSVCYNLDTFWFCAAIFEDLLDEISTIQLKQASEILCNQLNQILKLIFLQKIPKPSKGGENGSLYKKCCHLGKVSSVPGSISLGLPNIFSRLFCKPKPSFAFTLYKLLVDLDLSYRFFEKELLSRFLSILGQDN